MIVVKSSKSWEKLSSNKASIYMLSRIYLKHGITINILFTQLLL